MINILSNLDILRFLSQTSIVSIKTQSEYDALITSNSIDDSTIYIVGNNIYNGKTCITNGSNNRFKYFGYFNTFADLSNENTTSLPDNAWATVENDETHLDNNSNAQKSIYVYNTETGWNFKSGTSNKTISENIEFISKSTLDTIKSYSKDDRQAQYSTNMLFIIDGEKINIYNYDNDTFSELSASGNSDITLTDWISGAAHTAGTYYAYNQKLYLCNTTNTDDAFDDDKYVLKIGESTTNIKTITTETNEDTEDIYTVETTIIDNLKTVVTKDADGNITDRKLYVADEDIRYMISADDSEITVPTL